jgi:hypothetical protein
MFGVVACPEVPYRDVLRVVCAWTTEASFLEELVHHVAFDVVESSLLHA